MRINLKDKNLLLLHKGTITPPLIELILESLEQSVTNLEPDRKVRRKLTNVFIEAFQNIGFHGVKDHDHSNSDMIIVISRDGYYKLGTTNLIVNSEIAIIKKIIDEINLMDAEQLRERYRDLLQNNELSEKGTAGLGFVDIARKTGQRMYYDFKPVDENYSYFYFETRILKEYADTDEKPKRRMSSADN